MIGIGKWSCSIDTMMFRGDAILTIADENGAYSLTVEVPGVTVPEYHVSDFAEDGDTLTAVVTTPLLSGKQIGISLTFDVDTFTGFAKVPLLGKVKFKNGKRVD